MKYYYARVSTKEQNLDRQVEAAKKFGVDGMFMDKASGKTMERAEYQRMKGVLKEGDEVYFHELSRLGRNMVLIRKEIEWFKERGIKWHCEDIPTTMIDFEGQEWIGSMINDLLITVLGNLAEQERINTLKRQREGIDAMKVVDGKKISAKTGRAMGRPEKAKDGFQKIFEEQKRGIKSVEECCLELGISRATWYNKVRAC